MTQKQKARAYDKAFRIAQELYNNPNSSNIGKGYVCTVFPELKESEDDRIRNKLIKLIKMSNEVGGFALHKWEADEMLAWLEKQGEQKLAEWSEEDESILHGILDEILANKHDAKEYEWKTYDKFLNWLKSLKERIGE